MEHCGRRLLRRDSSIAFFMCCSNSTGRDAGVTGSSDFVAAQERHPAVQWRTSGDTSCLAHTSIVFFAHASPLYSSLPLGCCWGVRAVLWAEELPTFQMLRWTRLLDVEGGKATQ